ncbi:MAG: DMT family transporter [Bacteroidetes bacterium]|nr:DMT family transporter [Bacteroidota bacterium]
MININHFGEIAALFTAFCWTITALAFESATKKVGTIAVNITRLAIAFVLLSVLNLMLRGPLFPIDATGHQWFWLAVSGLVGFVLGDYFLFKSYPIVGSRIAMLMMTLVPPMTALIGWLILGESMLLKHVFGMLLVMIGIGMAVLSRGNGNSNFSFNQPIKGLLFAFLGAIGQAVGLVLSKYGMEDYNPFAATQIRIIAGLIGFVLIVSYLKRWKSIFNSLKTKKAMSGITLGSVFGPFLGVSFSLVAIKYTSTGIASTLMAIVPVLIIPPAIIMFRQKVSVREIIGAIVSVIGVVFLFL